MLVCPGGRCVKGLETVLWDFSPAYHINDKFNWFKPQEAENLCITYEPAAAAAPYFLVSRGFVFFSQLWFKSLYWTFLYCILCWYLLH